MNVLDDAVKNTRDIKVLDINKNGALLPDRAWEGGKWKTEIRNIVQ